MRKELHQCPCSVAVKCIMDEPCLGCEEYAEWLLNNTPAKQGQGSSKLDDQKPTRPGDNPYHIGDARGGKP